MRLGQLARKLSLRPAQIVEFLSQNNIQIEDNSNSRIEDNHTELVINHFAPGTFQQISESVEEVEETSALENELPMIEPVSTLSETSEPPISEETEVIRVQKIELSGLKVVGKIELPEPKKKEPVVENAEDVKIEDATEPVTENLPSKPERKPKNHNRNSVQQKRDRHKSWKNPLELQREREARAAEEKRRVEAEREKERRKRHYEEKRKSIAQPKRIKTTKEQTEVKRPVDTRPAPKTWLGKFLKWWTT